MKLNFDEIYDARLRRAGDAVSRLSRPLPPADLRERTLARVMRHSGRIIRRQLLLLRPITNPLARVLAAALIMLALFPMTDLEFATPLGRRIEEQVIGRGVVDRVERFLDRMLVRNGPESFAQSDLDATVGVPQVSLTIPHHDKNSRPRL